MRSKYVDDTTAFEIIPRNSISMLDLVVREILHCKEMYINFMTNSVTALRPIRVGYKEVDRVRTYSF